MYMPSIFGESLFDDMFPFDDSFFAPSKKNPLYGKNASRVMKVPMNWTLIFRDSRKMRSPQN